MHHRKTKTLTCIGLATGWLCISANASASVADILISEIMADPLAVSDGNGEWFELYNPTQTSVNLQGILLSDDGSNNHSISPGDALFINPGEYLVMARNGDPLSNGGFSADYVYSNFTLGNSSDQIIFSDTNGELLRLDYSSGFVAPGQSSELISLPMNIASYALTDAAFSYGLGDIGTPGVAGSFVPAPVPLPGAVWLFSTGLAGLMGISRRKKAS